MSHIYWLAVLLVHEYVHCRSSSESLAAKTELTFERRWPRGTDKTNAMANSQLGV